MGSPQLSPFEDNRRDSIALVDERTGKPFGLLSSALGSSGQLSSIGPVLVGNHDLRMTVTGGGQLLGVGRAQGVVITPGIDQVVTFHLRKPILFFGSSLFTNPPTGAQGLMGPASLMALDTTLPIGVAPEFSVPGPGGRMQTTGATRDGRYLLVGGAGTVHLLDTRDLTVLGHVALAGAVRKIVVSPSDRTAAVVTDQGLSLITDLPALIAAPMGTLPITIKEANARAVAFSPEGASAALLAGPSWFSVAQDCGTPTTIYTFSTANPVPSQHAGPSGATDVAYDATGQLLIAAPCRQKAILKDSDLQFASGGPGILALAAGGDRLAGVEGLISEVAVPVDPDNLHSEHPTQFFGEIYFENAKTVQRAKLPLPREPLFFNGADGYPVTVSPLAPSRFDAYEAALSPDGNHLTIAARLRYTYLTANGQPKRYYEAKDGKNVLYYCQLELQEDVYRVVEFDLASGSVGYQTVKGIDGPRCSTSCYDCLFGGCTAVPPGQVDCRITAGFAPTGLHILEGSQ